MENWDCSHVRTMPKPYLLKLEAWLAARVAAGEVELLHLNKDGEDHEVYRPKGAPFGQELVPGGVRDWFDLSPDGSHREEIGT